MLYELYIVFHQTVHNIISVCFLKSFHVNLFLIELIQHLNQADICIKKHTTTHVLNLMDMKLIVTVFLLFLEISCGVPPAGDNTNVPSDSLLYQDSYEYTCLDGYETNDTVTTNCLADRSLSLANPPNCTSE